VDKDRNVTPELCATSYNRVSPRRAFLLSCTTSDPAGDPVPIITAEPLSLDPPKALSLLLLGRCLRVAIVNTALGPGPNGPRPPAR
jgi:hypothetical protein